MNVVLLFVIIAAVCGAYYVYSCWRYPRVPCRWCGGHRRSSRGRAAEGCLAEKFISPNPLAGLVVDLRRFLNIMAGCRTLECGASE